MTIGHFLDEYYEFMAEYGFKPNYDVLGDDTDSWPFRRPFGRLFLLVYIPSAPPPEGSGDEGYEIIGALPSAPRLKYLLIVFFDAVAPPARRRDGPVEILIIINQSNPFIFLMFNV